MVVFPREELNRYNQFDQELYEYAIKLSLAALQKYNNNNKSIGRTTMMNEDDDDSLSFEYCFISTILLPTMSYILHVY